MVSLAGVAAQQAEQERLTVTARGSGPVTTGRLTGRWTGGGLTDKVCSGYIAHTVVLYCLCSGQYTTVHLSVEDNDRGAV